MNFEGIVSDYRIGRGGWIFWDDSFDGISMGIIAARSWGTRRVERKRKKAARTGRSERREEETKSSEGSGPSRGGAGLSNRLRKCNAELYNVRDIHALARARGRVRRPGTCEPGSRASRAWIRACPSWCPCATGKGTPAYRTPACTYAFHLRADRWQHEDKDKGHGGV